MENPLLPRPCMGAMFVVPGLALLLIAGCQQSSGVHLTIPATGSPRLVDLGLTFCLPCALMAPDLEELKREYAGRLEVDFIDTLKNPDAKTQYNAPFCATQIFLDASGKELSRHVGYYSKKDILAKWKELGVDLDAPPPQRQPGSVAPANRTSSGG
ncbi:MAG: thioredoxin family protein [Planctomycetota bacterium]|nr:thioredoxin family protein [Planctomycetota bacterium]